ncbi:MAG: antitoxin [Mogibacterium sp.]|nr:antitoxin [Mogibacterium sp.]
MRKIDSDGLRLCAIQGRIFEMSVERYDTSSAIFVRRFMNSELAREMDSPGFMDRPFDEENSFRMLDDEYGKSSYGTVKYNEDIMHWMGYVYRYWAQLYDMPSKRLYAAVKPAEMRALYPAYHSLDPHAAIQRIMESKGINTESSYSVEDGVRILKELRENKSVYRAGSGSLQKRK